MNKSSQVTRVLRAVLVPNKKELEAGVWLSGQEAHIPGLPSADPGRQQMEA